MLVLMSVPRDDAVLELGRLAAARGDERGDASRAATSAPPPIDPARRIAEQIVEERWLGSLRGGPSVLVLSARECLGLRSLGFRVRCLGAARHDLGRYHSCSSGRRRRGRRRRSGRRHCRRGVGCRCGRRRVVVAGGGVERRCGGAASSSADWRRRRGRRRSRGRRRRAAATCVSGAFGDSALRLQVRHGLILERRGPLQIANVFSSSATRNWPRARPCPWRPDPPRARPADPLPASRDTLTDLAARSPQPLVFDRWCRSRRGRDCALPSYRLPAPPPATRSR